MGANVYDEGTEGREFYQETSKSKTNTSIGQHSCH